MLAASVLANEARAQDPPPELTGAVNDFAGILDESARQQIARVSQALQEATGDVIVVATVKSVQPWADIRSYAVKMFENRGKGIGVKGQDNGMLVLLAVDDREVWVEVGYGLEPYITDGYAGETSRQVMVPRFRENDYAGGLLAGVQRLAGRVAEAKDATLPEHVVPRETRRQPQPGGLLGGPAILLFFLAYLIISNLAGRGRRRRRTWGRHWSGWSCGVGPFGGRSGGGGGGASW